MTLKTQKKPAGTPAKPQTVPRATSPTTTTTPSPPAKTPQLKPRVVPPTGNSQNPTAANRKTTAPIDPATRGRISLPNIKDPKTRADAQLITRVLDTQPRFAQLIASQAANGLLSGKQVNDLAALAKRMQVKGKNDPQVVKELSKAMGHMNPSVSEVFWKEFARGLKEDTGKNLKQFGLGMAESGKHCLVGLGNAVMHPVTTAQGIGRLARTGAAKGTAELKLAGQALGVLPGNRQAAQNTLKNQWNGVGQYVSGVAADPKKIGAVTANAMGLVLPVPGVKGAAGLLNRAGATTTGKAALATLDKAALKVGAAIDLGKGITGKVTSIVTGKDGRRYAVAQTASGRVKIPADQVKLAGSEPQKLRLNTSEAVRQPSLVAGDTSKPIYQRGQPAKSMSATGTRQEYRTARWVERVIKNAKEVNRDYRGTPEGRFNCTYCVDAMDDRLNGIPTKAQPYANQKGRNIRHLENLFGGKFSRATPSVTNLEREVSKLGKNATVIVFGGRIGDVGHVWNAIVRDGKLFHIDAQSGNLTEISSYDYYSYYKVRSKEMMIKSDAERIVQNYLDTPLQNDTEEPDNRRIVLPQHSRKYDDGWIICFESEVFLNTGDVSFALAGNYPIYVDAAGELFSTMRAESSRELLPDMSRRL